MDVQKEGNSPGIVKEILLCRSVYTMAFEAALRIFELSQGFPRGGPKSLHSQIIQHSSAVCENLTTAWQNRDAGNMFVEKLNEAALNASEAQNQVEFAVNAGVIASDEGKKLNETYESIIEKITGMIKDPETVYTME